MLLQFLINGVAVGSLYALVALSFAFIFGLSRIFHFAHASVFTGGVYAIFFLSNKLHMPMWLAIIGGVAVATLLGMGIERYVYLPLRRMGVSEMIIFMASFAMLVILENVIILIFRNESHGMTAGFSQPLLQLSGAVMTMRDAAGIITGLAVLTISWAFLRFSNLGTHLRAVADNSDLARTIGIRVDRMYLITFALGSAMTVPASFLMALATGVTPTIGMVPVLVATVAVIAGGVGSMGGAVAVAALLGVVENLALMVMDSRWQSFITYGFLFVVLVVKPTGFFGGKVHKTEV